MANTLIQIKRSSVPGKTPNTSTLSTGELAINLADYKLFSSNGTGIFEFNSNNSQTSNNSLYLGGTLAASYVQNTDSRTLSGNITFTANVSIRGLLANNTTGTNGQILTSNGSSVYWDTGGPAGGGYYYGSNGTVGTALNKNNIFRVNANTLYANVTFLSGEQGSTTGPLVVNAGAFLDIQSGARVVIL